MRRCGALAAGIAKDVHCSRRPLCRTLSARNPLTPLRVDAEKSSVEIRWPIEEEIFPNYNAEAYFPIRIGQVFHKRYGIRGKPGYGVNSTVWLSWDIGHTNPHTERLMIETITFKIYIPYSVVK
jgi:hypothetical protein